MAVEMEVFVRLESLFQSGCSLAEHKLGGTED